MILVHSSIDYALNTEIDKVNTVIVENSQLFYSIMKDIYVQKNGNKGGTILFDGQRELSIAKNLEIIDHFFSFDFNSKSIITQINNDLEKKAITDSYYSDFLDIVNRIETLFGKIQLEYSSNIQPTKLGISSILKSLGIEIVQDFSSLSEQIINFMEIQNEFVGKKLYVIVNIRSFISDSEFYLLLQDICSHDFDVIFFESHEMPKSEIENRIIIDQDLCIIR